MSYGDGFPSIRANVDYTDDRRYIVTVDAPGGTVLRRIVDTAKEVGRAQYELGAAALGLPRDQILVFSRDKQPPWLPTGKVVRIRPDQDHQFVDPRGGLAVISGYIDGALLVSGIDDDIDGTSVGGIFPAEQLDDTNDFTPAELNRVQKAQAESAERDRQRIELANGAPPASPNAVDES